MPFRHNFYQRGIFCQTEALEKESQSKRLLKSMAESRKNVRGDKGEVVKVILSGMGWCFASFFLFLSLFLHVALVKVWLGSRSGGAGIAALTRPLPRVGFLER